MTLTACMMLAAVLTGPAPLHFERQAIDHVTYEAASICDVNNDGIKDIVSGEYWFPGPEFKAKHKITTIMPSDDYYDDFSDYPMDVNGDGFVDIVSGGWFGQTLRWFENPKGQTGEWTVHDVAKTGNIERNTFCDIDNDGVAEVFPVTSPVYIFKLKCDAGGKGTGAFDQFIVNPKGGGGGHGFGCGDINSDGHTDLIFSGGWLESPANPYDVENWAWHKEFDLGSASVPILVFDVNKDGLNDIIVGAAHDYGLWWYEQKKDGDARTWIKHDIDLGRSQYHDIQLHDIDNDGDMELITGKRYRAHAFHDPGSKDPLGVYYFEINKGDFQRVTIDYGPAGQASGVGIYFWVDDIDQNGWKDVLAPGKEGLYLFRNFGPLTSGSK
ncbi:MAG TPA: VCBS repeat-containing protein [Candidatus Hydrogenedentes bacterium]|nr:VCBS repeat-containing protein [Candidatus Hydrogenedentota bacterium]